MSHSEPVSSTCDNCRAALVGPYCAACGQKALPLNPRLHDFVHELTHELLHVDGKLFRSVRKLLLSPGFLTREEFEGRRVAWVRPIRLYLVFSLVYFALATLAPDPNVHFRVTDRGQQSPDTGAGLRQLGFESEQAFQETVRHAQATWAPRVMFLLVPFYAWLVHLATRRTGRNFPQHLYFALHVHAAWFVAGAVLALARWTLPAIGAKGVETLAVVYAIGYAVLAFRHVYGVTTGRALLRMGAILAVYFVGVVTATLAFLLPVIFWYR